MLHGLKIGEDPRPVLPTQTPRLAYLDPRTSRVPGDWQALAALETLARSGTATGQAHGAAALAGFVADDLVRMCDARGLMRHWRDAEMVPRTRIEVAAALGNRRNGSLDLEPIYGRGDVDSPSEIGDGMLRREEARLHTRFRRLHRQIAHERQGDIAGIRREARWTYQWIAVNALLPELCEPAVLAATLKCKAPAQTGLAGRLIRHADATAQPVTLETALAVLPMAAGGLAGPGRALLNRGHLANLPTAQALLAVMRDRLGIAAAPLAPLEMGCNQSWTALDLGRFWDATPLVWYLYRESQALHGGRRFGPLGSWLMAEAVIGAVITDSQSYWDRRWRPGDGALPASVVRSFAAGLLRPPRHHATEAASDGE